MFRKEASITITKTGDKITRVKVDMPAWIETRADGKLYIDAPLLGIETYGVDKADLENAVNNCISNLIKGSEKYGRGFEQELIEMGWDRIEEETFSITSEKEAIVLALQSGTNYSTLLEVA